MITSLKKNETFEYQKLSKEEMAQRGILGRLVGPVADFVNPTRNGRKYNEQLWENVFNNPIMQEKIKNGVCFGELGHPADRTETVMEKIAISMREMPKKSADGKLIAYFDILDTPNGRILKTLCDYGSNIGISSRGTGDVVKDDNGEDIVDPDTYDCECWDVVLVPAVESARPQYVKESINNKTLNLKRALTEELNSASADDRKVMEKTLQELNIKVDEAKDPKGKFIKTTNSPISLSDFADELDVQEIKHTLGDNGLYVSQEDFDTATSILMDMESELDESKKNESIPEKGGDKSTEEKSEEEQKTDKPEEAVADGSDELIKNLQEALKVKVNLEAQVKSLQEKLAVNDIKVGELTEELGKYKDATARLSSVAADKKKLQDEVKVLQEDLKKKEITIDTQTKRLEKLVEAKKTETTTSTSLNESIKVKDGELVKLNESLKAQKTLYEAKISELTKSLDGLKTSSDSKERELTEKLSKSNKIKESYKKLANDTMLKYIDSKAAMLGVTVNEIRNKLPESYSVADVDAICEDLKSYELNISKLPFSVDRKVKVKVHESKGESLPVGNGADDDIDDSLLRIAGLKK